MITSLPVEVSPQVSKDNTGITKPFINHINRFLLLNAFFLHEKEQKHPYSSTVKTEDEN